MASSIEVAIDQQGIEPINMDDDMMSEYYNTTNTNAQNDDHAMIMMMEEAEQDSSNIIADTILNDAEIASVSNEVMMEEDGNNNDMKVYEGASFASTSYPHPSIPTDVEIEHSTGVDLPDETIGDAVYEVEESEHIPSVNAIVAEQEETKEEGSTTFDSTDRPEAEQIARETEEIILPEPEGGTLDSNDEYATERQLSESANDGKEKLSEKAEITEESVNNSTREPLVVIEEQINIQDEAAEDGTEAHISTSTAVVEQSAEKDVENHSSAQLHPIRVTFDGQDFVLYPDEEPSAFISINHERVQAPTLPVETKVFSEPLETLFEALRIREALGDFLDEGTELCLTFHDLDMIAREDDIYIREVTLDDIQRLHSGLGYTSSMHINVSESQRFISRYNDLANQVSVLIEQKTENESIEQGKGNGEQAIELSGGEAGLEIVNGDITASSKEEAADEPTTEVEAERKEVGEEEEIDQDEEDTFVTVTNDEDNDEEQYAESYEEGGEIHNQLEGDEEVGEKEVEEHHPRQLHFFSIQAAPAETNEDLASVQEESSLETKPEEETYTEQLTEKVEGGNEESIIQEKDSSRDTGTTLSGDGEEAEEEADPDYEPAEEIDAVNEEEGAEEDFQGIEEAYEDYEEEEEGGQEEPFDDDDSREEEDVEKAEAEEAYDNENDFEPQVGSHGQKRQFEDDLEYSTEDLNGEGIDGLEHNEDDSKRARYEEPEKEGA